MPPSPFKKRGKKKEQAAAAAHSAASRTPITAISTSSTTHSAASSSGSGSGSLSDDAESRRKEKEAKKQKFRDEGIHVAADDEERDKTIYELPAISLARCDKHVQNKLQWKEGYDPDEKAELKPVKVPEPKEQSPPHVAETKRDAEDKTPPKVHHKKAPVIQDSMDHGVRGRRQKKKNSTSTAVTSTPAAPTAPKSDSDEDISKREREKSEREVAKSKGAVVTPLITAPSTPATPMEQVSTLYWLAIKMAFAAYILYKLVFFVGRNALGLYYKWPYFPLAIDWARGEVAAPASAPAPPPPAEQTGIAISAMRKKAKKHHHKESDRSSKETKTPPSQPEGAEDAGEASNVDKPLVPVEFPIIPPPSNGVTVSQTELAAMEESGRSSLKMEKINDTTTVNDSPESSSKSHGSSSANESAEDHKDPTAVEKSHGEMRK